MKRTLALYRNLSFIAAGGEDNAAVRYFDAKIAKEGPDAEVLADDSQMLILITSLLRQGPPKP